MTTYFTILLTFLFLTACGSKSTGNSAASSVPLATDVLAPSSLIATVSASSVAPGAIVTASVIGGTAPYTWVITSGGGTLSSSAGTSVVYTAGPTAALAYLTVTDAVSATTTVSVNISTGGTSVGTTAGNVCQGNYAITLGALSATAQFTTTGTTLSGTLLYAGYPFTVQGTCAPTGVSFVLAESGDTFTGTFTNPNNAARASIAGTYQNVYYNSTQNWTATPQ